jgi:hypothetical protein
VGKNRLNPKSFEVYIPSRGKILHRGNNYRIIDHVPESWKWKNNPRLIEKNSCAGERLSDSDEDHEGDDNSEIVSVDDDFTDDFDGYWRNHDETEETEDSETSLSKTALIDMISSVQSSDQSSVVRLAVSEGLARLNLALDLVLSSDSTEIDLLLIIPLASTWIVLIGPKP